MIKICLEMSWYFELMFYFFFFDHQREGDASDGTGAAGEKRQIEGGVWYIGQLCRRHQPTGRQ